MSEKFEDMSKDELMEEAQRLDIDGRSTMDKAELLSAVKNADGESTDEGTDTQAATVDGGDTESQSKYEFQGVGPGDDKDPADVLTRSDGLKAGGTDTDPVLDSEADYSEPEVEYHDDTNEVKSRREEEDEQHARREAGDAIVEEIADKAGRTPY